MEQIPEVFDWVTARASCSASQMFVLLTARVESDVRIMQARFENSRYLLSVSKVAGDSVVVARQVNEGGFVFDPANVIFTRTELGVGVQTTVKGSAKPLFEATVSLGPDGRCRYEVAGQPMELWQVSRKALEGLFFS